MGLETSRCPMCAEPVEGDHAFCPFCAEPLGKTKVPAAKPSRPVPSSSNRSVGVTVFGVSNVIGGVLALVSCIVFVVLAIVMFVSKDKYSDLVGIAAAIAAVSCFVVGLPHLLAGIGLLRRRPWARILTLVLSILWIGCGFIGIVGALVSGDLSGEDGVIGALVGFLGTAFCAGQVFVLVQSGEEFTSAP